MVKIVRDEEFPPLLERLKKNYEDEKESAFVKLQNRVNCKKATKKTTAGRSIKLRCQTASRNFRFEFFTVRISDFLDLKCRFFRGSFQ